MDKANFLGYLSEKYGLHPKVAALLLDRGIDTPQKADAFFDCSPEKLSSPYILPQMDKCVERLRRAIDCKEKILVFGDYDCDGIGATAILYKCLKSLSADVDTFIPLRKTDGYGIKWESLSRALREFGPSLIVSVDCGISSYKEIARAREEFGVDFIITDHHSLPEVLPDTIIINPHLADNSELCGAGVAFMVAIALTGLRNAIQYVDICALSTVADLVPLRGDNRIIVSLGLEKLNARKTSVGIKALIDVCGMKPHDALDTYDLAFKLIPRLNSSGRLDSAESSLKLLTTDDVFEATVIAGELDERNRERQKLCEEIYQDALLKLRNYDIAAKGHILLCDLNWDSGVLGIAASKLVEAFGVPVVLLTEKNGLFSGSGRSVEGVNMFEMLSGCAGLLAGFGGHSMAAGLQLEPENLEKVSSRFTEFILTNPPHKHVRKCELELNAEEVSVYLAKSLKKLAPFGMGNKNPSAEIRGEIKFERIKDYNHVKARLGKEGELIAFSQGKNLDFFNSFGRSYAARIEYEIFRNAEKAKCYFDACAEADYNLSDEWLTTQFLSAYLKKSAGEPPAKRSVNANCGNLVVTYSPENYRKFLTENGDYSGYVFVKNDLSIGNSIILAPANSTVYSYWSSVTFLDAVPEPLAKYINTTTAATVKYAEKPYKFFLPQGLDMNKCEAAKRRICRSVNGKKFTSFKEIFSNTIYNLYNNESEAMPYDLFLITFLSMIETGTMGFDREGRIVVVDETKGLADSLIMKEVCNVG